MKKIIEYRLYFSPLKNSGHIELKVSENGQTGWLPNKISLDASNFCSVALLLAQKNLHFEPIAQVFYSAGEDSPIAFSSPQQAANLSNANANTKKNEINLLKENLEFNLEFYND